MLRLVIVGSAIFGVTLALIPFQWLALKLGLRAQRRIPVLYHRILCSLIGVRVRVIGSLARAERVLIACNHASWLDISVLISVAPVVFVAKSEVGTWPLFGLLARLNRSVFVERERRHKTADVNRDIAGRLTAGDPVVLFAEGTSGDGNRILSFRSSLFGAVQVALSTDGSPRLCVQPAAIVYTGLNGLPLGRAQRPRLSWYGAMDLLPHLAGVIRGGAVDVLVQWGEPMAIGLETDRKSLTRALEEQVRKMAVQAIHEVPFAAQRR